MQAIIQQHYGSAAALELQSRTLSQPVDDQIRVRIHAAPVTAADSLMRQGKPRFARLFVGLTRPRYPVPGTGFSGTVDAVGPAVTCFRVGDAVMGESIFGAGTHSTHVCLSETALITHKPETISHAEASAVCDGPLTSWNFLHRIGRIRAGERVLINGAAGSLGSAAVQIAALAGARVSGVCSARNADWVRELGAENVIDYRREDPLDTDQPQDLIFDAVGKLPVARAVRCLSAKGRYLSPVLSRDLLARQLADRLQRRRRIHFAATGLLPVDERGRMLDALTGLLERQQLKLHVDARFPLADIARAYAIVDSGHKRGSVVVEP